MELNRNTEVESLHVSPPDAKPMLPAVASTVVYLEDCVQALKRLDGLHTFEQSLKDFYNAWEVLNKGGGVIVTRTQTIKNTQGVSKTADSGVVMFTGLLLGCIQ